MPGRKSEKEEEVIEGLNYSLLKDKTHLTVMKLSCSGVAVPSRYLIRCPSHQAGATKQDKKGTSHQGCVWCAEGLVSNPSELRCVSPVRNRSSSV